MKFLISVFTLLFFVDDANFLLKYSVDASNKSVLNISLIKVLLVLKLQLLDNLRDELHEFVPTGEDREIVSPSKLASRI